MFAYTKLLKHIILILSTQCERDIGGERKREWWKEGETDKEGERKRETDRDIRRKEK